MLGFSLLMANCHRNHGSCINSDVNHSITTEKMAEDELLDAQRNLRLKKNNIPAILRSCLLEISS